MNKLNIKVISSIVIFYFLLIYYLTNNQFGIKILGESNFSFERSVVFLIATLITCIPILFSKGQITRPSSWFIIFQLIFVFIPSYSILATNNLISPLFVFLTSIGLLFVFFLNNFLIRLNIVNLKLNKKLSLLIFSPVALIGFYGLFIILSAIINGKVEINNLINIDSLYTHRELVFSSFSTVEFIVSYALGYFFFPLGAIYAIEKNKKFLIFPLFFGSILLFLIFGIKTYIFIILMTACIYYISIKNSAKFSFIKILILICAIIVIVDLYGIIIDSAWPNGLIFDRGLMTPGQLHLIYGFYFENKISIPLWKIFDTNIDGMSTAEDVMANVFGGTVGNGEGANAGLIATAYARYGWVGVIFHLSIISIILSFLDKVSNKNKYAWISYSCIPSLFLLTNIDLFGVLFYFGLILVILSLPISGSFHNKISKG
jgi:hypothetical protein